MALITLPWIYVPNKDKFGTYFDAKIYVGEPDSPNPRTSQKEARLVQEDGTTVIAQQPIRTNAGGIPVYNGSVVALDVDGDYSLAIDDSTDQQKYYFANIGSSEDFLTTDLRAIMFDLGLTYDDIGLKLITDLAGTSLDGAEYILNTDTGEVWNLGDRIPSGATVVSLTGDNLVTSLGSFTLEAKQSDISQALENQIKINQNWNVFGLDANLTTTAQTITNGNEFTFGWIAYNADIVGIARSATGITTWTTGTARYTVPKDLNGLLTVNKVKFYVNDGLGTQIEADGTNGLTVSDDANNIYLDIDETIGATGIGFVGWSLFEGVIPAINDELSALFSYKKISVADYKGSNTSGGSAIAGTQTRTLNTILTNTLGATLNNDRITLDAGTYVAYAEAPAYRTGRHRISVKNSDDTITIIGSSAYTDPNTSNAQTASRVEFGDLTITQQDDFRIVHYTGVSFATSGLGISINDGLSNIYTQLTFWKIR
jgi:hypothetical protein